MNELEQIEVRSTTHDQIDKLEAILLENLPLAKLDYRHYFAPGMYGREMSAKAGTMITSQIHKYDHEFKLWEGSIVIWINGEEIFIEAPYKGITKAGTRRIGYVVEDVIFTTYHVTNIHPENDSEEAIEEAVRLIGEEIIEEHINPLLGGVIKNNILVKTLQDV
jgi:hypothetical protein